MEGTVQQTEDLINSNQRWLTKTDLVDILSNDRYVHKEKKKQGETQGEKEEGC